MEFEYELKGLFSFDENCIAIFKGDEINKKDSKMISFVLDEVGGFSAKVV